MSRDGSFRSFACLLVFSSVLPTPPARCCAMLSELFSSAHTCCDNIPGVRQAWISCCAVAMAQHVGQISVLAQKSLRGILYQRQACFSVRSMFRRRLQKFGARLFRRRLENVLRHLVAFAVWVIGLLNLSTGLRILRDCCTGIYFLFVLLTSSSAPGRWAARVFWVLILWDRTLCFSFIFFVMYAFCSFFVLRFKLRTSPPRVTMDRATFPFRVGFRLLVSPPLPAMMAGCGKVLTLVLPCHSACIFLVSPFFLSPPFRYAGDSWEVSDCCLPCYGACHRLAAPCSAGLTRVVFAGGLPFFSSCGFLQLLLFAFSLASGSNRSGVWQMGLRSLTLDSCSSLGNRDFPAFPTFQHIYEAQQGGLVLWHGR